MAPPTSANRSDATDEEDEVENADQIIPPDGGWGWVVTASSFMCRFLTDGLFYSFGLIMSEMVAALNQPVAKVAWMASLSAGLCMMVSPFAPTLVNWFKFRAVIITGTILGSAALAASSTMNSIDYLTVTIGLAAGFGFALICNSAFLSVTFYFDRHKSLATAIAACGSGIGTLVMAQLTVTLLDNYGWRGTLLILSSLCLNCCALGALFRPLETIRMKRKRANAQIPSIQGTPLMLRIKRDRDQKLSQLVALSLERVDWAASESQESVDSFHSLPNEESTAEQRCDESTPADKLTRVAGINKWLKFEFRFYLFRSPSFVLICISSFFTSFGYLTPYMLLTAQAEYLGHSRRSASYLLSAIGIVNTLGKAFYGWITLHPKARVYPGKVSALIVNNVALTACGAITIFNPLFSTYPMLVLYAVLYGLTISCLTAVRLILLADLVSQINVSSAFNFTLLFSAVSTFVGLPLAGLCYDLTGNYDNSFYLAGSLILFSAVLCYPIGYINRWEKQTKATSQTEPI